MKKIVLGLLVLSVFGFSKSWYIGDMHSFTCVKGPNDPATWTPMALNGKKMKVTPVINGLYSVETNDGTLNIIAKTKKKCLDFFSGLKKFRKNK